ncbi:MAG: BadF/BadG/BcrA/BcrD ATPase family protein [Clostridiales bacterium]
MDYIVAVDGGGTKTAICISDVYGKNKTYFYTGNTNYKSAGIEKVKATLYDGLKKTLEKTDIHSKQIYAYIFGLSGMDSKEDYTLMKKIIEDFDIVDKYYLHNDSILPLNESAEGVGIVTISGTGSISYGIDCNGAKTRSGGWGYKYSDLGSGYWIGNQLLTYLLMYCDGFYMYQKIFEKLISFFEKSIEDLPYFIATNQISCNKIAELAKFAFNNTDDDILPNEILKNAAFYLAQMTTSVYEKLDFKNSTVPVVLSGGVLKNNLFKDLFKKEMYKLNQNNVFKYIDIKGEPVNGGIQIGLKKYWGKEYT